MLAPVRPELVYDDCVWRPVPSKAVPSGFASTCTLTLPRPHAPRAFASETSNAALEDDERPAAMGVVAPVWRACEASASGVVPSAPLPRYTNARPSFVEPLSYPYAPTTTSP